MTKRNKKDLEVRRTLRIYYRESLRHKRQVITALALPLGITLRTVIAPFLVSILLAHVLRGDGNVFTLLWWLSAVSLGGVALELLGIRATMRLDARVMAGLHDMVFRRLLKRSTGYYADRVSGKLVSDVYDFVNAFCIFVNSAFIGGVPLLMMLTIGLGLILFSAWQLGLLMTVMVGIVIYLTMIDARKRSDLRSARLVASKQQTAHTSDSIVNIQTVKTFANEHRELEKSRQLNHKLGEIREHDWVWATTSANFRNSLILLFQLAMLFVLIELVRSDPKFVAAGIFAFTYTLTISGRLFEVNNLTRQLEEVFLQAQPVAEMLGEADEIKDMPNAGELHVRRGAIDFQNVSFTYGTKKDQKVFHNLTLHIKPGQKVGLVGPSGGGKSTFTKLLLRFEDVDAGQLSIDGQDITGVTQQSLRRNISYVPQEPLLFHRSIRDNIAYGKPGASRQEITTAAETAFAHDFIQSLPHGYDTVVGERGAKLSGGQRQRIAIARAILENASILLLDEATSALDSESEGYIQKGLASLMTGKTTIVVAHRLSTIQHLDRIIVLKDGTIEEDGKHDQLLKQKGLYAKLWEHQSGGFIDD